MPQTVYIDFETRSGLSLDDVGPWVYSLHPSTEILCLAWRTKTDNGLWISETTPDLPVDRFFNESSLNRLFSLIEDRSNWIEAHNVFFEKCIWWNIAQRRLYWPSIDQHQWRCSAAKAAACALPRALLEAGLALGLSTVKDEAGKKIMEKLTKANAVGTLDEWERLYDYCENDVAAEQALSETLPDLIPRELHVWAMDQRMNRRGIPCDTAGARAAVSIADEWTKVLNAELAILVNGRAKKATQKPTLKLWLAEQGVDLPNMQANTIDAALETDNLDPLPRRVLEIIRSIGRSSVGKYKTLLVSSHNGRLHDTLKYHGAVPTGRWTASRFQPQNLVRSNLKEMAFAWSLIHSRDIEMIQLLYGDPMEFLSHSVRGVVQSSEGKQLYSGDYNAVETRVLFWLAGEERGLDIFRRNEDIYLDMASDIYGRPMTKADDEARQLGKRAILGLGFQMGYLKFLATCWHYGQHFTADFVKAVVPAIKLRHIAEWIREEDWHRCQDSGFLIEHLPELCLMKFIVDRYRARYRETVCKMWDAVEQAAISAVLNPDKRIDVNRCQWHYDGTRFLTARLPSGRLLYYPFPKLTTGKLTHMGIDSNTKQWVTEKTYGGKITENLVQAVARDYMADAMVRLDQSPNYDLLMSVHDEAVCESDRGDVREFTSIIAQGSKWANGLPIKVDSWTGKRYRK